MKILEQKLANTGERILLEQESSLMISRHMSAYKFAKNYVADKRVLDLGCGQGYGCGYLSLVAKSVLGIDYDQAVIDYAKVKYQRDNLEFRKLSVDSLNSIDQTFDTVCAFQFIEHIENVDNLLQDLKKLLAVGGVFVCSTPNRNDSSPGSETPFNKFHVREYLWDEFKATLCRHFSNVEIFGLKRIRKLLFYRRLKKIGLFNFLPPVINPVTRFYKRADCNNFEIDKRGAEDALDFIAVCER